MSVWILWDTLGRAIVSCHLNKSKAVTALYNGYDEDEREYIKLMEVDVND